jgi:GT2 family glycosyltransferase
MFIRKLYYKAFYRLLAVIFREYLLKEYMLNDVLRPDNKKGQGNSEVDIILPIFNGFEYLVKCIDSIINNSDKPFNLYLLNDSSTDSRISNYLEQLQNRYNSGQFRDSYLKSLIIISNKCNKGFVKNINQGFKLVANNRNNIVIINSDVEVPKRWLSRITYPFEIYEHVASVTPMSNSATILSIPDKSSDNPILSGFDIDKLDTICQSIAYPLVKIPTGIGFCMAINKKALNDVGFFDEKTFELGYGEENDWCMRVANAGFTNIAATNLFVYHKHGVSFGELLNKKRQKLKRKNYKKLVQKHPNYEKMLQKFMAVDPLKEYRIKISERLNMIREMEK